MGALFQAPPFRFPDLRRALNRVCSEKLEIKPLTPEIVDAMGIVLRGSWGSTCWCMYPRITEAQMRNLPGEEAAGPRRRAAMTERAGQTPAPGLIAFEGEQPVGWIAIAPRDEFTRVARSRATPPVDDEPVWVIPCITVRKAHRGRGIASTLIDAAVAYAGQHGATSVEAYPRAGEERTGDDNAYFGTEKMFTRAGFDVIRGPLENRPRNWIPRLAMRIATDQKGG